jgi:hypothetical protein
MQSKFYKVGVWISVIFAALQLVTMVAAFNIDGIVNHDLYSYGLQFNNQWALPYWTAIRSIFAVSWITILTAIGWQIFLLASKKKKIEGQSETDLRNQRLSNRYTLSDGAMIEVKHNVKNIKRLPEYSPEGLPMYVLESDDVVQVVSAPERLKKKTVGM